MQKHHILALALGALGGAALLASCSSSEGPNPRAEYTAPSTGGATFQLDCSNISGASSAATTPGLTPAPAPSPSPTPSATATATVSASATTPILFTGAGCTVPIASGPSGVSAVAPPASPSGASAATGTPVVGTTAPSGASASAGSSPTSTTPLAFANGGAFGPITVQPNCATNMLSVTGPGLTQTIVMPFDAQGTFAGIVTTQAELAQDDLGNTNCLTRVVANLQGVVNCPAPPTLAAGPSAASGASATSGGSGASGASGASAASVASVNLTAAWHFEAPAPTTGTTAIACILKRSCGFTTPASLSCGP